MQLITKHKDKTDKWFKTLSVEPDFMKGLNMSKIFRHSETVMLECKSLEAWNRFMHESGKGSDSGQWSGNLWSGTQTWEQYLELLEKGDDNVMKKIKVETDKALHELEKKYKEVVKNYKYDVAGEFFDIGLVLSGLPECWLEPIIETEEGEVHRITMRINMGFRSGTNSEEVINNGARLLSMAKMLENMGAEVSIELYNFADGWYNVNLVHSLLAKDFDEPINYRKLSSLLTTAYQRRGSFRVREVINGNTGVGASQFPEGFTAISNTSSVDRLEAELFERMKK